MNRSWTLIGGLVCALLIAVLSGVVSFLPGRTSGFHLYWVFNAGAWFVVAGYVAYFVRRNYDSTKLPAWDVLCPAAAIMAIPELLDYGLKGRSKSLWMGLLLLISGVIFAILLVRKLRSLLSPEAERLLWELRADINGAFGALGREMLLKAGDLPVIMEEPTEEDEFDRDLRALAETGDETAKSMIRGQDELIGSLESAGKDARSGLGRSIDRAMSVIADEVGEAVRARVERERPSGRAVALLRQSLRREIFDRVDGERRRFEAKVDQIRRERGKPPV